MNFKEISINEFEGNPFELIGRQWMLITAGNKEKVNTMTASWGGLGVMWYKNVSFIVIRPTRYTKKFVDENDTYSLCFFDEKYKKELSYLGSTSGRDEDKIAKVNFETVFDDETPYFSQARMILICRKLYAQPYKPEFFTDKEVDKICYPKFDHHTIYIGEITKVLVAE